VKAGISIMTGLFKDLENEIAKIKDFKDPCEPCIL
jgi:hypothetical protein